MKKKYFSSLTSKILKIIIYPLGSHITHKMTQPTKVITIDMGKEKSINDTKLIPESG
jgi:hypothetical protein